jgi:hypothetical protein
MTASMPAGREEVLGLVPVGEVEGVHRDVGAGQRFHPADHGRLAVGEVVDDDDVVAGLDEGQDRVGSDVAGTAGDENAHGRSLGPGAS